MPEKVQTTPQLNGNPLQYSCLENPMGGGAWWATVHGSQRVGHDWVTSLSLCILIRSIMLYKQLSFSLNLKAFCDLEMKELYFYSDLNVKSVEDTVSSYHWIWPASIIRFYLTLQCILNFASSCFPKNSYLTHLLMFSFTYRVLTLYLYIYESLQ